MIKNFTFLAILILLSANLFAQRLLTEDFNYAAGQLTDSAGGANVSGGKWVPFSGSGYFIQVVDGSLSYPGYVTNPAAGSRKISLVSTSSSAEDVYSGFASQTSGTVYASFLLSVDSTTNLYADTSSRGEYFAAFLPDNSTTNYVCRVVIRKGSEDNTYSLGILSQSTTGIAAGWSSKNLKPITTYLVTIGFKIVTGDKNDVSKIWINPANTPTEPAPDAVSLFSAGTEPANIGRLAFRQASRNTPSCNIDAIKVSTTWADGTLPVTLTSFNATLVNNRPVLSWTTANEINMKGYVVERSSNGKDFSPVTEIAAKGDTKTNSYSYTDAQVLQGAAWYRLKMVDKDGTSSYSGIRLLSIKGIAALLLKENPVRNNLVFTHSEAESNSMVRIINSNGIVVLSQKLAAGATQTSLSISALAKGNYYLVFINGSDKATAKFLVQ